MFERMLIVLQPGPPAAAALGQGLALAAACHAEVVFHTGLDLSHVALAPSATGELPLHDDLHDDLLGHARGAALGLHAQARARAEALGLNSRSSIVTVEQALRGIVDAAAGQHCDLIVAGCAGGPAWAGLLTGDCLPALVKASPLPLLVCPARAPAADAAAPPLHRILVVLEPGDAGTAVLGAAIELAGTLAAELLLVHVTPNQAVLWLDVEAFVGGASDQVADEIHRQSQRLLAESASLAGRSGLSAQAVSLPSCTSGKDLARLAAARACDLVVVARHRGPAVLRLLGGTLVPGLVSAAAAPVLVCPVSD